MLRSCIAAREIACDGLKPRSFTIHIAGSIYLPLLSCVDRKPKKGENSEKRYLWFSFWTQLVKILNKIARSFAPPLDRQRKFSTIYSITLLKSFLYYIYLFINNKNI